MPRPAITKEWWERLVAAFRANPAFGAAPSVARAVGCDVRTARKAWEIGLSTGYDGARRPIKDVLAEEQAYARARMADQQAEAERGAAELEAQRRVEQHRKEMDQRTEARVQEGYLVQLGRKGAQQMQVTVGQMLAEMGRLLPNIKATVDGMAVLDPMTGRPRALSMGELRVVKDLVGTLSGAFKQANDAGARALEMERVVLGEPTKIIANVNVVMTAEDMARRIEGGYEALQAAREMGLDMARLGTPGYRPVAALPPRVENCSGGVLTRPADSGVSPDGRSALSTADLMLSSGQHKVNSTRCQEENNVAFLTPRGEGGAAAQRVERTSTPGVVPVRSA